MFPRRRIAPAFLVVLGALLPGRVTGGTDCLPRFQRIVDEIPAADGSGPVPRPWLGGWEKARPQFGDADGDGDQDLFVFEDIGRLRLYRNDGPPAAPSFTFVTDDYAGVQDLYFGRVVDIDVDGDLDLFVQAPDFVSDAGGTEVLTPGAFLYTNVATAAAPDFQNLSAHPEGYLVDVTGSPIPMVTTSPDLVDLEGDGDVDLLFGDPTGSFFLYRNVGTPSSPAFQFETDHYDDLLVVFGSCGSSLSEPVTLSELLRGTSLRHGYMLLSFFDLEGDGRPDLFLGDQFNSNVYYIKNQGGTPNPHFTCETQSYFPPLLDFAQNLVTTFSDLDGDGDPDALVGSGISSFTGLFQFRNDGPPASPTFSLVRPNFLPELDGGRNSSPCFADLDGGGRLDLYLGVLGPVGQRLEVWGNVGSAQSPAFTLQNPDWLPGLSSTSGWSALEFADLDSDADLDLFVGTYSGAVRWWRNDGTSTAPALLEVLDDPAFGAPSTRRINAKIDADAAPRFVDDDGDGDLDLVVGAWNFQGQAGLTFFRNDGTRTHPDLVYVTSDWRGLGILGQGTAPAFGDVDGDGDADLVVGRVDGTLAYFSNEGTSANPGFAAGPDPWGDIDIGGDPSGGGSLPFLVALDADADLDLAVGELGGGVNLYRNVGPLAPAPPAIALLDPPPGGAIDGREPYRFDWSSSVDPVSGQECVYELRLAGSPTDPPWTWRIVTGLTQSEATITLHQGEFRYRPNFAWTVVARGCRPAPIPAWRAGVHSTWDSSHFEPPGTPDPVQRTPPVLTVAARPIPTRADVTVTVAIPEVGRARIEVFDARGRRVATLWDGAADVGERTLVWDGRDAAGRRTAPGIYFVRATLGERTASRRVVLLR